MISFEDDAEYVDVEPEFFSQKSNDSDLIDVPEDFFSDPSSQSGDFIPGIKRGTDQLQAMGYGAVSLAGSAVGADGIKDWGMEGYRRNMAEAEENPKKNSFKDVYTGKAGVGGTIDWMQGTLGELVPSMAEAAVGALIGSAVAPGPGTVAGGLAGRTILKKSIEKLTKEAVESQIKRGIVKAGAREVAEAEIKKQVTRQALKKLGGKIGMGAAVLPMESGGNYAGLLEENGIDAPGTALFFGALATSLEYAGGNSELIDALIDGVANKSGGFIKRAAKELVTNIPQETLQEGGQEVFSILNTIVNTDEKFLTGENIDQIIESMGAGAVGGMGGAFAQSVIPSKSDSQNLLDKKDDNKIGANADQAPEPFQGIAESTAYLPAMGEGEYSDTIPFAGVPNEEELGWMSDIEKQRNPQVQPEPAQPMVDPVQKRYQENQQQMENMAAPPDYSVNDGQDLLAKNIDEFRRVRSQEASVSALENRQQAMGDESKQWDTGRLMNGIESMPDESGPPMPSAMPSFQRNMDDTSEGKYLPFAGLSDQIKIEGELSEQSQDNYDDGIEVSAAEFEPSSVRDQRKFQQAMGDNFGMQDMPDEGISAMKPIFEHEVIPDNVNTEPTEAQIEAGNYKKEHIKIDGLNISIENPDGSTRKGKDKSGKEWQSTMTGHYGYVRGSEAADKDHVDVFIKPGTETSPDVFVIDQIDPKTGKYDEPKAIFGVSSEEEAKELYYSNYEKGWKGFGAITRMGSEEFKTWVKDKKKTKKPVAILQPVSSDKSFPESGVTDIEESTNIPDAFPFGKKGVDPVKVIDDLVSAIGTLDIPILKDLPESGVMDTKFSSDSVPVKSFRSQLERLVNIPPDSTSGGIDAKINQAAADGVSTDTHIFGDSRTAHTIRTKGFDSLDVKIQGVVQRHMLSMFKNLEVFRSIVELLPVGVMDVFMRQKFSTKSLLGDNSMFLDRFSIPLDDPMGGNIGRVIDSIAASLPRAFALRITEKIPTLDDSVSGSDKGRITIGTENDGHKESPSKVNDNDHSTKGRESNQEKKLKLGIKGRKSKTYLNDNTEIEFEYEVIDAADLVTSHDDRMNINQDFPSELQPRERSRKASLMQVNGMALNLNPERLGSSSSVAQGAPIVGDTSNVVESGNGRVLAIRKAYSGKTGLQYKKWINSHAMDFGITDPELNKIKKPVLVRRRITKIDNLAQFTQKANEADTAKLSSTEQAIVDANNLSSDDLATFHPSQDGDLTAATNKVFIDRFIGKMTPEEQSGYLTEDGRANKQLIDRVQSAIFQRAYGSNELLKLTAEEADPDIKNILNGLTAAAAEFAKARGLDDKLAGMRIIDHLVDGVLYLRQSQKEYPNLKAVATGTKAQAQVNQALAQQDVFGNKPSDEAVRIAKALAINIRSGKRIGEFISAMGSILRESISDLNQMDIFGKKEKTTSALLINKALSRIEDKYADRQQGLFGGQNEQGSKGSINKPDIKPGTEKSESSQDPERTSSENAESGESDSKELAAADAINQMDVDDINAMIDSTIKKEKTNVSNTSADTKRNSGKSKNENKPGRKSISGDRADSAEDPGRPGNESPGNSARSEQQSDSVSVENSTSDVGTAGDNELYLGNGADGTQGSASGREYSGRGRDSDGTGVPSSSQRTDTADRDSKSDGITASDAISKAVKEGVKGVGEALSGLHELFGGNSLRSFPGAIDEKTYQKAKPHFQESLKHFQTAGKSLSEYIQFIVDNFSDQIKPYLKKFIREIKNVSSVPFKRADKESISHDLPQLFNEQQEDVLFAETRFENTKNHGVMFTNGTGTGKTYTGLGIVKREVLSGKKDILIVVPNDKIATDWISSGKDLDINIHKLKNTKDNGGKNIVVTTYANFGANESLVNRKWDMVIGDEAHNFLQKDDHWGATKTLNKLRGLTGNPLGSAERVARWKNPKQFNKMDQLYADLNAAKKSDDERDTYRIPDIEDKITEYRPVINGLISESEDQMKEQWKTRQVKTVFLSATPFAYRKSIDYAAGYLFDYGTLEDSSGYNAPGAKDSFFVSNFGYRMRYNKLTEPEAQVDVSLMEREFNNRLRKEGAVRSRILEVDQDYERRFISIDGGIGAKIDEGLEYLWEQSSRDDLPDGMQEGYRELQKAVSDQFDYLRRSYLLESIKSKASVPIIKDHLALGRKVVLFHNYNKGGGFHPFKNIGGLSPSGDMAYDHFSQERSDLINLDFSNLYSPIETLKIEFGDQVVFFNGTVPKAQRAAGVEEFNRDNSGVDIIVAQADAGGAGISLHDTTGKKQRVLLNVGLPVKPVQSIQIEGRIYRVAVKSNALFRYFSTDLSMERYMVASKLAERSSTAENLAMGDMARGLRDAFVNGYADAAPHEVEYNGEGQGGKESDRGTVYALSEFDRAKTYYFSQQKKTSKNKSREGIDYFATPEPLGLKMVEWAGLQPGMKVVEPSAGHGAIARWFPENITSHAVEPSYELASKLSMNAPFSKIHKVRFEDLDIINKYDAIVMNPPFGLGGAVAIKHLGKAFKHLSDNGRIVALIPEGPAADKAFNKWYESDDAKDAYIVAEVSLPDVTFERAATKAKTKVVIIDKIKDVKEAPIPRHISMVQKDMSINDLFDSLKNISIGREKFEKSETDQDILEKNGLSVNKNEEYDRWDVTGEGTFDNKDVLKAIGAKWNRFEKAWTFKKDPTEAIIKELKDETKFSTIEDFNQQTPGQGISLKDIQSRFKGQQVFLSPNGDISIRLQNGSGLKIVSTNQMGDGDTQFAIQSGRMSDNGVILGKYKSSTITLNKDLASNFTRDHELYHFLKDTGMITPADGLILINEMRKAKNLSFKKSSIVEENEANMFAQLLESRESERNTSLGSIIQKVMDFIDALVYLGRQSARKMARSVESGGIFSQKYGQAQDSKIKYHRLGVYSPSKTVKAYKLFRTLKTRPGEIFPLFIGKSKPTPMGEWIEAEFLPTKGFAERPGWHSGTQPSAPHLMKKDGSMQEGRVWAEIEIPNDVDWQEIADKSKTKDIQGEVPKDGFYRFKRPGNQGLEWRISGAIKVNRILSEKEVDQLNSKGETLFQTTEDFTQNEPFSVEDNSGIVDDLKYNIIDMLSPVSKVYKAVKSAIPEYADFRLKEQLRVSKAKGKIDRAEETYFAPIKKIIGMAGLSVENVDEFLYARHAPEANARLRLTNARHYLNQLAKAQKGAGLKKKIDLLDAKFELEDLPTNEVQAEYKKILEEELSNASTEKELKVKEDWKIFSAKPSGMTDSKARELSRKWEGNKAMTEIAKIFDRMNDESLEISYQAGRLSKQEYESVKGTFDYYAPLFREGHEKKRAFSGIGTGVTNLGTDVKTRGGSTKKAVHLLANAIVNHEKTIIKAEKAEVAKAFLEFVKMNPNRDFWDFEETKTRAAYDTSGNIVRVPAQMLEPNEVKIKVNGKTHIISANPENVHAMRILDIIQGNQHQSGPIVNALSRLNRFLAAINTTLNPEFIISNLTRDLQTAAFNLNDTDVKNMKTKVFKSIPSAMKGLHSIFRGDGKHEWAKIAKRYEAAGARIGWIDYGRDIETKAKKLESQIDLFREGYITKKSIDGLFSFIEDYNSIVENAVRLSTFKAGIDSGMSEAKAAIMAKGLTVNFNQKGAMGPVINSLYLFANAGIQGSTRIVTALKNSPGARKMVLGSVLAATGMAIANSNMGGDDEDGVPYYDQIDDFLKARNMIIMIPGSKGDFVKIPLPWGYNVFWAFGTEMGDAFTKDNYNTLEGTSRMITTVMDAFNPLQSATILQTISPTIADPFAQVGENKTFFGSPLMPEGNPFAKFETPDSQKYWGSARETSKFITQQVNNLTGGNKIKPGLVDISPETLDLVFDTFTGGAGRFILDTASFPLKATSDDFTISKAPIIRRVLGTKSEYKTTTDYRENTSHVYQLIEQMKTYPDKTKKLQQDRTYQLIFQAKKSDSMIKKLNKFLKAAKSKGNKEAQEKIEQQIEAVKKAFNKNFSSHQ